MIIQDILSRLEGVRPSGDGWTAKCPAHDDKHASLSVGVGQDGKILLNCHAGCDIDRITYSLGIAKRDLFPNKNKPSVVPNRRQIEAIYEYPNGVQKIRYVGKDFMWRRPSGKGGWTYNRQGVSHSLYVAGELSGTVYICEGEKDANNVHTLGFNAVSGEDGAGRGKWYREYAAQLNDCNVVVIQDNDATGKAFAQEIAAALHGAGIAVKVLDLCHVWPDIPEKGDVSDLIEKVGAEAAKSLILKLADKTPEWTPAADPFLACFKTLDAFDEQEAEWLIPGWVPKGQICLMGSDGGVGKTSLWCHMAASISSGRRCILDPDEYERDPQCVAFLSTEDSVRKKLKKKLRLDGANMKNIIAPDFAGDKDGFLRGLKFGSKDMEKFVRNYKPALCIFDPVQGFVPPDINMGSRNAMRDCMAPLVALGEETGTTFLVVCHTNKRANEWGRKRLSDSSDLWDVSRSVVMLGFTDDEGIRYLSNEKNNYTNLQKTVLFSIDEAGNIRKEGTSWKRDREYVQSASASISPTKRADCKEYILSELDAAGGSMRIKELDAKSKAEGYANSTLRRAKEELKRDKLIHYFQTGAAQDKTWFVGRTSFVGLPDDTEIPWTA